MCGGSIPPTYLRIIHTKKDKIMKKMYLILPDGEKIYCSYGEEDKLQKVIEKCNFDDGTKFLIQEEDRTSQEEIDKFNEALLAGEWKE